MLHANGLSRRRPDLIASLRFANPAAWLVGQPTLIKYTSH